MWKKSKLYSHKGQSFIAHYKTVWARPQKQYGCHERVKQYQQVKLQCGHVQHTGSVKVAGWLQLTRSKFSSCSNLMGKMGEWRCVCCSCPSRQTRTSTGGPSRCTTVPWVSFHWTYRYNIKHDISERVVTRCSTCSTHFAGAATHSRFSHFQTQEDLLMLFLAKKLCRYMLGVFSSTSAFMMPTSSRNNWTIHLTALSFAILSCSASFACRTRRRAGSLLAWPADLLSNHEAPLYLLHHTFQPPSSWLHSNEWNPIHFGACKLALWLVVVRATTTPSLLAGISPYCSINNGEIWED